MTDAPAITMRSWLFAPGDSEKKMTKAMEGEADVVLIDLEDAVSDDLDLFAGVGVGPGADVHGGEGDGPIREVRKGVVRPFGAHGFRVSGQDVEPNDLSDVVGPVLVKGVVDERVFIDGDGADGERAAGGLVVAPAAVAIRSVREAKVKSYRAERQVSL